MRKSSLAIAVLASMQLIGTGVAHAQEESPFSANVSLTSDYAYRGISQTDEGPALQGGFDFKHSSGFYLGTWGSSISWLRDVERGGDVSSNNSLELDVYGGYAHEFGDFGIDVGLLQYFYPGSYNSEWKNYTGLKNPNTLEGYVGLSWKFLSFKYSHAFTDLFGAPDSKGSQYFDLSASYEIADGISLDGHYGHQMITGPGKSYYDWKLGVTASYWGVDFGLHYVDTDISHKDSVDADARYIFSVTKSF
jgi:uncharacterized protein (TIGR02001 family)